jgi:hypothetical protein
MAAQHGKDTHWLISAVDLTTYKKTANWETNPDIHDITGSGTDDKSFRGGQIGRTFTLGGWTDDDDESGPWFLEGMAGVTVSFEHRPDGSGTGLRKRTGNCIVGKFVASDKNDDIVQWTCDFTVTGAVVEGTQA